MNTTTHEQKGVSQMSDGTDLVKRLRHFGKSLPPENDNTHRYEAELTLRAADHIEKLEATLAACEQAINTSRFGFQPTDKAGIAGAVESIANERDALRLEIWTLEGIASHKAAEKARRDEEAK